MSVLPDWVTLVSGTNGQAMTLAASICLVIIVFGGLIAAISHALKDNGCSKSIDKLNGAVEKLAVAFEHFSEAQNRTNELLGDIQQHHLSQSQKQNEILMTAINLSQQKRPIERVEPPKSWKAN